MKQQLIERFIKARQTASPVELNSIGLSVRSQFNRDVWQLSDKNGLIRISKYNYMICCYNTVEHCDKSGENGYYEYQITKEEYFELERVYFGYFEPDYSYLRRIKSI